MITSLLVDVDGTLIDTRNIFYDSLNSTLSKYHIPETYDQDLFGMSVDQALSRLGLAEHLELKKDWESTFNSLSMVAGFYENIVEMAKTAFNLGIRIIIITSRSHITADPILDCSELSPYIIGCIAAEDTVGHKPSPEPLFKAMEQYDVHPESALYVGDSFQDYLAATAANVQFAFAGWNKQAQRKNYNIILNDPLDVFGIIQK